VGVLTTNGFRLPESGKMASWFATAVGLASAPYISHEAHAAYGKEPWTTNATCALAAADDETVGGDAACDNAAGASTPTDTDAAATTVPRIPA
jgi:hypothetical protein